MCAGGGVPGSVCGADAGPAALLPLEQEQAPRVQVQEDGRHHQLKGIFLSFLKNKVPQKKKKKKNCLPPPSVTGEVYCIPRRQLIFSFGRRVIYHSKGL